MFQYSGKHKAACRALPHNWKIDGEKKISFCTLCDFLGSKSGLVGLTTNNKPRPPMWEHHTAENITSGKQPSRSGGASSCASHTADSHCKKGPASGPVFSFMTLFTTVLLPLYPQLLFATCTHLAVRSIYSNNKDTGSKL